MNNIYVETMPETCEECSCCYYDNYAECYKCPLLLDNEINIYDKDSDCPLKLLTDRLAEERKKVVQEIRDWCDKNGIVVDTFFDPKILKRIESRMCYVHEINKQLDQIENGNKDES